MFRQLMRGIPDIVYTRALALDATADDRGDVSSDVWMQVQQAPVAAIHWQMTTWLALMPLAEREKCGVWLASTVSKWAVWGMAGHVENHKGTPHLGPLVDALALDPEALENLVVAALQQDVSADRPLSEAASQYGWLVNLLVSVTSIAFEIGARVGSGPEDANDWRLMAGNAALPLVNEAGQEERPAYDANSQNRVAQEHATLVSHAERWRYTITAFADVLPSVIQSGFESEMSTLQQVALDCSLDTAGRLLTLQLVSLPEVDRRACANWLVRLMRTRNIASVEPVGLLQTECSRDAQTATHERLYEALGPNPPDIKQWMNWVRLVVSHMVWMLANREIDVGMGAEPDAGPDLDLSDFDDVDDLGGLYLGSG